MLARRLSVIGERLVYRPERVGTFIAVSDAVAQQVAAACPRIADRVVVVPNGVDTDRFRPDAGQRAAARLDLGVPGNALLAAFVGSEWVGKGLAIAIDAVAARPEWRLVVVGGGDRAAHQRQADEAGAGDRVIFSGLVREPERFYAASDVLLHPSSYETFSLAAYEAAASSIPIVARRIPAIEQLVRDDETGLLVSGDAASFAEALAALGADADRRQRLGAAARRRAMEFSWDAMVDAYLAVSARQTRTATAGVTGGGMA